MSSAKSGSGSRRRVWSRRFWRFMNPVVKLLAGWAPWWVVVETTGRRSGKRRRVPLARGPRDGRVMWLTSVHGRRAGFALNLEANPAIRIKTMGRWYGARATVEPLDDEVLRRFNFYARSGPRVFGLDPVLIRVEVE